MIPLEMSHCNVTIMTTVVTVKDQITKPWSVRLSAFCMFVDCCGWKIFAEFYRNPAMSLDVLASSDVHATGLFHNDTN